MISSPGKIGHIFATNQTMRKWNDGIKCWKWIGVGEIRNRKCASCKFESQTKSHNINACLRAGVASIDHIPSPERPGQLEQANLDRKKYTLRRSQILRI